MKTTASSVIFGLLIGSLPWAMAMAMGHVKDLTPAQQACAAYGGGMELAQDCKAFDGSPGNITALRVCVDGDTAVFLMTNDSGQVTATRETEHHQDGTTFTYVAAPYSLEVPAKTTPNDVFDAVFKIDQTSVPLVCTSSI